MTHTKPDKVLLRIGLTLLDRNAQQEASWLDAFVKASSYVDRLVLKGSSFHECPDALNHWLVRAFVDICRTAGIPLYWGRELWVCWKTYSFRGQKQLDAYDSEYYTAALSGIRAEAKALEAEGTYIYCEPNGDTIFRPWFKENGFESAQRNRIAEAIQLALGVVPPVDFASPAGSLASDHYSWTLRALGRENFHSRSYCVRTAEGFDANAPDGVAWDLHWWGVLLGAAGNPHNALTVDEYAALDFARIKGIHPECKGVWLNPVAEDRRDVMYRLGELAG